MKTFRRRLVKSNNFTFEISLFIFHISFQKIQKLYFDESKK